jgi:5-methyltetrahydrofolate--homocysteine methyltransferase
LTIPRVSSALKAVDLKQLPPPLIIGERINTQGSRKAKQLVLNDDYDGLVDLARICNRSCRRTNSWKTDN